MSQENRTSRRQFLTRSAQGAALLGIGGTVGYVAGTHRARQGVASNATSTAQPLGSFRTGAARPRGIAVGRDDRIYIVADRNLASFANDGTPLGQVTLGRPARCVATRQNGDVLVGLARNVEVFDADLTHRASWKSLGNETPINGLAVAGDDVFVADALNELIWQCDGDGNVLNRIRRNAVGAASPTEFFSLAIRDGRLHVANPQRHRIESYTLEGGFVSSWGERSRDLAGFSGCCNPVSFAMLGDGRFVTAERGQPRVKLYDSNGQFSELLAGPEQFSANAQASATETGTGCQTGGLDLALDSRERILILDRVTAEVHFVG
ncbi:MAG: hypothetical protein CMJ48_00620 [Planctomycetaceae bacterium]|nr:hypothetical protein [Planctomycetaceae bacterium]